MKKKAGVVLPPALAVCVAVSAPPMVYEKLAEVALSVSDPEVTVRVTGIVSGLLATAVLPCVAAMVTVPLYVPGFSVLEKTLTLITLLLAVVPEVGPANSQVMPSELVPLTLVI